MEGREKQHQGGEGSSKQQQQQQVVVVVWDLDETLVLFQSLCNGAYAAEVNRSLQHGGSHCAAIPLVDPAAAHAVGSTLTTCLFDLLDRHLMYEKVEFLDPMHLQEACLGPPYAWQQSSQRGVEQQDLQQGVQPLQQQQQQQQPQQHAPVQHMNEGGTQSSQQQQQQQQQRVQHEQDEHTKHHHQQATPLASLQGRAPTGESLVAQPRRQHEEGAGTCDAEHPKSSTEGQPQPRSQHEEGAGTCDAEHPKSSTEGQQMTRIEQGYQEQHLPHLVQAQQHAQAFLQEQRLQQPHQPRQQQEPQRQPQEQLQHQPEQGVPGQQLQQAHRKGEEEQQAVKRKRSGPYTAVSEIFQRVRQLYMAGFDDLPLSEAERKRIMQVRQDLDVITHGWSTQALALLHDVSKEAGSRGLLLHHCIVTTGQLVATLGKLMLFGLGSTIRADMVYSASKLPKLSVFAAIRERFGPSAAYVAVGDGNEERCAAEAMRWPFVQISLAGSWAVYEQPVCPTKGGGALGDTVDKPGGSSPAAASLQGGTGTKPDSNAEQQQQQHQHQHQQRSCSPEAVQVKRNGMRVGEVSASVLLELALQTLNCQSNV